MIKVEVGNSYSKITGLSPAQERELRGVLSYTVGSYHTTFGPRKVSLLDKKGSFPTGLLHRVQAFLNMTPYQKVDGRSLPPKDSYALGSTKYYDWQLAARTAAHLAGGGIISAPTGTGKSMAIKALCTLGHKTLIVVPSLELKRQLAGVLADVPNVTVDNIDSTALKKSSDFDMLIIDEMHHSAAKTYQKLNKTVWTGIRFRYGFTATPFRNNTEETLLFESIAGPVIYKLSYKDAVASKYIVPVDSYYLSIPKQATDAYTYSQVYSQLIVNNEIRNLQISVLLARLNAGNKATLCLVKEIAHGKILSQMTGLPFVSGADDESRDYIRQFNSGKIVALIGTTGVLGEGIDTKPCEYVIIAGGGKAKSQFMQAVGRAVRTLPGKESAKVIIIKDASHKFLTRHYNAQKAILNDEYGSTPIKLDID